MHNYASVILLVVLILYKAHKIGMSSWNCMQLVHVVRGMPSWNYMLLVHVGRYLPSWNYMLTEYQTFSSQGYVITCINFPV